MSFSNHRWFQFSNHRWFQFWHVSGCDLGASTLKGTESYTYSIGRWSTKHKFGAAHLARESSANWIQTRYCFGYLNHRWFRNHRWLILHRRRMAMEDLSPVISNHRWFQFSQWFREKITGDFCYLLLLENTIVSANHRWFGTWNKKIIMRALLLPISRTRTIVDRYPAVR
jgi:hypothetical protein